MWRYKLKAPFRHTSPQLAGIFFANEWVSIHDGTIEIAADYAWDGCSPAWRVCGVWLGTPDGPLMADGRPQTFYASLVHDVLCQFSRQIPIKKAATVELFRKMLLDAGFAPWRAGLYAKAVDLFGPQDWGAETKKERLWPEKT